MDSHTILEKAKVVPAKFDEDVLDAVRVLARKLHLEVVDNVGQGGACWVVGGYELATLLGSCGLQFAPQGGGR